MIFNRLIQECRQVVEAIGPGQAAAYGQHAQALNKVGDQKAGMGGFGKVFQKGVNRPNPMGISKSLKKVVSPPLPPMKRKPSADTSAALGDIKKLNQSIKLALADYAALSENLKNRSKRSR